MQRFVVPFLLFGFCALSSGLVVSGAALDTPTLPFGKKPIAPPQDGTADLARVDVYSAGTLTYKQKQVHWFSIVEPTTRLIAAVVVTPSATRFNDQKLDRSVFSYHDKEKLVKGVHVTFFYVAATTCTVEELESGSCDYNKFMCDIVSKLGRVSELSGVYVDTYVSKTGDGVFWCGSP